MTGRVLVVDDVPQNVKLLEAKLSSEYYTVFTASNGMEALEKAKEIAPDIILLDVMMPGMDGFEVCRKLKAEPETAFTPVVMVTALSEMKDRIQGLKSGANDFITKPIDEIHLFARVKSLIRYKVLLDELRMRDKTREQFGIPDEDRIDAQASIAGKVLVVDDDIVQLNTIKDTLSRHGHTVIISDDSDALENVGKEEDLDLIIINTLLDSADGLRLAVNIRTELKSRQVPIIILVDEDDKPLLAKGFELGIDDYIMTPLDSNELIARVSTQMKSKRYQDKLRSAFQETMSASVIDSLTKLYNRRYLDAHLGNIVEEALRKNAPVSLLTLDIDHFKEVNDRPGWGHHIGDEVLIQIADRIKNSLRTSDLPTRPGGEEFVVVMPNTPTDLAKLVAERIRGRMANKPFEISAEPGEVNCTVSIGLAGLNPGDKPQDLLKRSDEALYQAKQGGRNKVCVAE